MGRESTCPATALPRVIEPVNLSIAKWIWTGEKAVPRGDNPTGPRAFRKNFTSTCGKCAISAKILAAAYLRMVMLLAQVLALPTPMYYTALEPASNLFAMEATNTGGPAGLAAAILVQYSDGLPTTTVDDRAWSFAAFQDPSGVAPWGKAVIPQALDIANSSFVWVGKRNGRTGRTSKASRAFRKTIVTPGCTKRAVAANVLLNKVEWRQHWWIGRAYYIPRPTLRPDVNVFAVNGTNGGGPASVIATIHISYDDGAFDIIRTDETWKASLTIPNDFASPTSDNSTWTNATNLGFWGRKPWRQTKFPKA
ncbi:hypothetical protein BDN71DRAFT_1480864 [Pleurotus eryngii]|uniref:Uncharacterized protein n=1 Tax=Pleurotus eryngii TaxID=5323 RepID=A0A9P6A789_PLEER|nr:hypothetical protein BDN71DRAFT_1480864 [Pleurotus eryngii]